MNRNARNSLLAQLPEAALSKQERLHFLSFEVPVRDGLNVQEKALREQFYEIGYKIVTVLIQQGLSEKQLVEVFTKAIPEEAIGESIARVGLVLRDQYAERA